MTYRNTLQKMANVRIAVGEANTCKVIFYIAEELDAPTSETNIELGLTMGSLNGKKDRAFLKICLNSFNIFNCYFDKLSEFSVFSLTVQDFCVCGVRIANNLHP